MTDIPFIFVHLGEIFFPEYVNIAIKQCRKWNNTNPIYFIGSIVHKNKIITSDVKYINIEEINSTKCHINFINSTRLDSSIRFGFGKYSTERLFILDNFAIQYNIEEFYHLENDNMVYFSSSELIEMFRKTVNGISSPALSMNQNTFGLMYCNNISVLSNLCEFFSNNTTNLSDMDIGSIFFRFNRDKTFYLPSIPNIYDRLSNDEELVVSNKIELFKGIFDPAQYGQWLGGIDPRNNEAKSGPFIYSNSSALIEPKEFKYIIEKNGRYNIIYKDLNICYPIYLLHIHSKHLDLFYS